MSSIKNKLQNIFGKKEKFTVVDGIICIVILLFLLGIFLVKGNIHKPLNKVITGTKTVEFTILTRAYDVTAKDEIFKQGEKTFITIRNVPYTELEIVSAKKETPKEMFFNEDRPDRPYLLNNVAYPNRFQYTVTVKDKAQITNDGAVIGGNKIKIGLPVDLEGFNYRLSGTVSNVKIVENQENQKEE